MTEYVQTGPSGIPVEVTAKGQANVRAVQIGAEQFAINQGVTWNITTGRLTLTDANATVLHYVKNTTFEGNLVIPLYIILTQASTGGDGSDGLLEILRNPTSGDIITNANLGEEVHQNFGGTKPFPGINYKGATSEGAVSGQDGTMRSQVGAASRLLLGIITYLPQGASIAIQYTPPVGNSSLVIESIMEIYEELI